MGHTPHPASDAVAIGQVLLGKYRVDAILGQGGMGVVAKCTHLGLNEHVAIKMLRQDVMLDQDATQRFMREAQAASRLKSEHVARVVDVGTFPENDVPYMIMEFLDGHDLGDLVDERGPLQAPFASMLMLMAAEALAEAHANSIVHRDVKPSNLFVTWRPDGSALVKVLDFGISKSPMGTDLKLTQTQSLLGTPAYMSPEQMRSARLVDSRTDIWSLGTVFYELLEGRRPFEAESFSEMCVKVAVDPPAPMTNTPPALQQIILRCLAKNPDQRYATMAELGRDLLPHVQDVHQASLLVERMQRMLGRSRPSAGTSSEWDGSSGAIVRPSLDHISAPVVTGRVDAPFARAPTPDPRVPILTHHEESRPARALSEVIPSVAPAPRSKRTWMFGLVALLVAGAAGAVVLATRGGDPPAPPRPTETVKIPATQPEPSDKPMPIDKPPIDKPPIEKPPIDKPMPIDEPIEMAGSGSAKPETTAALPSKPPKNPPNIRRPNTGVISKKPSNPIVEVSKDPKRDQKPVVGEGSGKKPDVKADVKADVKPVETKTLPPLPKGKHYCNAFDRLSSGGYNSDCVPTPK